MAATSSGEWAPPQAGKAAAGWLLSVLCAYVLEGLAARGSLSPSVTAKAHVILGIANLVLPVVWVFRSQAHPLACVVYLFQAVVIWMKLISYAHVNYDLRAQKLAAEKEGREGMGSRSPSMSSRKSFDAKAGLSSPLRPSGPSGSSVSLSSSDGSGLRSTRSETHLLQLSEVKDLEAPFLQYPQNVTLLNVLYFCVIPTLCYQLNYPRSKRVRSRYVATLLLRMLTVGGLIIFMVEQHMAPILVDVPVHMHKLNVLELGLLLLRLSIPNTYCWLLSFYWYFHLWLNFLAEITRFGDRLFYKDWW